MLSLHVSSVSNHTHPTKIPPVNGDNPFAIALASMAQALKASSMALHVEKADAEPLELAAHNAGTDGCTYPILQIKQLLEDSREVYFDRPADPKIVVHTVKDFTGTIVDRRHLVLIYAGAYLGERWFVTAIMDDRQKEAASGLATLLQPLIKDQIGLLVEQDAISRSLEALRASMDCLAIGLVVVNQNREMIFVNKFAARYLRDRSSIDRFENALIGALASGKTGFASTRLLRGVKDSSHPARQTLLLTILDLPVTETEERPSSEFSVVILADPEWQPATQDIAATASLFGLTRVESELAARLVKGEKIGEAAAHLNISVNTARAYLKSVFSKTLVHRQQELTRLLCRSVPPLNV